MAETNIQQSYDLAVEHHQAGRLHEAEQLYRKILENHPDHAGAMHYLGVVALQTDRTDDAVKLIRRAIAISPNYDAAHNNLGNALRKQRLLDAAIAAYRKSIELNPNVPEAHRSLGTALREKGHLDDAIAAFREAISLRPNYADAHNNLGNALKTRGDLTQAIAEFRLTISLNPDYAEAHNNLGNALMDSEKHDDAIAAYRKAISLRPDYADAHSNLGISLRDKGQTDEAIAACRQAIALKPDSAEAHGNLGVALRSKGQLDEAISECRQAIALNDNLPEAHSNLGHALTDKAQFDEAIAALNRAIALKPRYAEARMYLGIALQGKGQLDEAVAAFRQAISLKPNFPEAYCNLGDTLRDLSHPDEAIAAYREAISLNPKLAEAHNNLGNALRDKAQLDEAIAEYRQAIAINPSIAQAHSNLIYAMHIHPNIDPKSIAEENRRYDRQYGEPLRQFIPRHTNDRNPDRRLRIGYVSPDLRNHVVAWNILPLFEQRDSAQFEVTGYAQVRRPDETTRRLEKSADRWRNIVGLSYEQAAEQIRQDQIDILVDLAVHTANSCLLIFARKPAPVQVTFCGYPGSTGLSTVDYRLSDPYLDPVGMDESIYTEKTIRLPDSVWCYNPLEARDIPVNPLPAQQTGVITFGCLNSFAKINDPLLAGWAQIMRKVPKSQLLLLCPPGSHRQRTLDFFRQEGIDPARIELIGYQTRHAYFEKYHRVDLGLDTFPWNGHSTSLDSYWMGVPVVSRMGQTAVSRAGWSQLSNLGLSELIVKTIEEYVQIAVDLAKDPARLAQLRATLRQRMEQSPLMDAPRFARNIESAYRRMWRTWCEKDLTGR
jgi:predicted O-linked N-acetylglucosamine transferase (SPINDLY family)